MLSSYTELNNYINLKFNNFASCTYEHIRNSLITIFLIGILITTIFIFGNNDKYDPIDYNLSEQNKILENVQFELNSIGNVLKMTNEEKINSFENQDDVLNSLKSIDNKVNELISKYPEKNK